MLIRFMNEGVSKLENNHLCRDALRCVRPQLLWLFLNYKAVTRTHQGASLHQNIFKPNFDTAPRLIHRARSSNRKVCIAKMEFDEQGYIKPVKITRKGVDPVRIVTAEP